MILELAVAIPLLLIGLTSAWRSLAEPIPAEGAGDRLLVSIHQAAKAGFWLAFGTFFLLYGVLESPDWIRWFVLVPLGMAAVRLATALALSRRE
jgi:hypothetical protein